MEDNKPCRLDSKFEDPEAHWDKAYENTKTKNWTERAQPAIHKWLTELQLNKNATILCAGAGDSFIIDYLLDQGFTNIVANDISGSALDLLKTRIDSTCVTYVKDDLVNPTILQQYHGTVDLYIDRATLHFFTTCRDKDFYFDHIKKLLSPEGIAMIGVFSQYNNPKCSGLDLQLWSMDSLKNRFNKFVILDEFQQAYVEINDNIRNYIYLMVQNQN